MERQEERQMENTRLKGVGHSSPIVWGKKIFLTTALDGEVIPGRTAGVTHKLADGTEFVHPDAVGANLKHTFKVSALIATLARFCGNGWRMKVRFTTVATEKPALPLRHPRPTASMSSPSSAPKACTPTTSTAS